MTGSVEWVVVVALAGIRLDIECDGGRRHRGRSAVARGTMTEEDAEGQDVRSQGRQGVNSQGRPGYC